MSEKTSTTESFRYSPLTKKLKSFYRIFFPVPHSSRVQKPVKDICSVDFIPPKVLTAFFVRALKILKDYRGESVGDYLEFGVFNGGSLFNMYRATQKLGMNSVRFFGFDAFEGLPESAEHEDDGVWTKGFYKCTFEQMQNCLRRKGMDPDGVTWVKGWFDDTLNAATAKKYGIESPGIIFLDCDTYSSSKAVLNFVTPLIKKEVIICVDDWKLNDLDIKGMGEYRAFNEFLEANPHLSAREIPSYNRESKSFLVKPRRERG